MSGGSTSSVLTWLWVPASWRAALHSLLSSPPSLRTSPLFPSPFSAFIFLQVSQFFIPLY